MSVASSAASMRSVNFHGRETSLEQALDETIKGVQNHLNSLQVALRNLAACEDQAVDDEEDFRQMVALEDEIADTVGALNELLGELPDIASDIRGTAPNPAMKAWHRTTRLSASSSWLAARRKQRPVPQPRRPPPRLYPGGLGRLCAK